MVFPEILGILMLQEVSNMQMKTLAVTAGLGAAAGMVAVLMMPKSNPTRKLASRAANKVEDIAWRVSDSLNDKLDTEL